MEDEIDPKTREKLVNLRIFSTTVMPDSTSKTVYVNDVMKYLMQLQQHFEQEIDWRLQPVSQHPITHTKMPHYSVDGGPGMAPSTKGNSVVSAEVSMTATPATAPVLPPPTVSFSYGAGLAPTWTTVGLGNSATVAAKASPTVTAAMGTGALRINLTHGAQNEASSSALFMHQSRRRRL